MTIAIGGDAIDVLVHGRNRYFDNYRTDSVHGVRLVYPFGYCGRFPATWLTGLTALAEEVAVTKQLDSSIGIDASPERVWEVLTDFGAYPEWNPFIVRADGTPAEGSRLTVRMPPVGAHDFRISPAVVRCSCRPGSWRPWASW